MPDVGTQSEQNPSAALIASLFQQGGTATPTASVPATGVAPAPAAPAQAGPGGSPDIMQEMIERSRQGGKVFGEEVGKSRDIGSQIEGLVKQQQATPVPKQGWMDTQGQPQQGSFLHNLGRALMAIGGATVPGQAIQQAQYGPGIRRYEEETSARAKEIEQLRGQQEEAGKIGTSAASMVSKPISAGAQATKAAASMERADAYVPLAAAQAKAALAGIDLKKATLDEKGRSNLARELQAKVDEAGRNFREQNRDATAEEIARVVSGTKEAIANEVGARNPSLKEWAMQALGMGTPQLPGAQSPQQQPTPSAPAKKAGASAAPTRPKGVPAEAVWNPQVRRWQLPNK